MRSRDQSENTNKINVSYEMVFRNSGLRKLTNSRRQIAVAWPGLDSLNMTVLLSDRGLRTWSIASRIYSIPNEKNYNEKARPRVDS
jgi:hypothetical protein